MKHSLEISIIVPTYNERGNIIRLIKKIQKVVNQPVELIVVDDNSPDGTAEVVATYMRENPAAPVRLIRRMRNHGLTRSLRRGIRETQGSVILWMDCDFSHPPDIIPALLAAIRDGCDIAVASRYVQGGRAKQPARQTESSIVIMASIVLNKTLRFMLKTSISDFTSGFVAVRKSVLESLPLRGDYGEYFIDFIVRANRKGYTITEIPYTSPPRVWGESKTAPNIPTMFRRAMQYGITILRLYLTRQPISYK